MHTNHLIIFALLATLLGCKKSDDRNPNSRLKTVIAIHDKAKAKPDSFFADLKKAEKLIAMGGLPDSLKGNNDFLLGRYYARNKNLDSAAVYFYSATQFIKDSIANVKQVERFTFAHNVHYRLGKFGDCLALSKRYESLLNDDADYIWKSVTHYMDAQVHLRTKDYERVAESNAKRIAIYEQANDTIEIVPVLMSQAQAKFFIGEQEEAFGILEDLIKKEAYLSAQDNRKLFSDYAVYLSEVGNFRKSRDNHLKSIYYKKKLKDNSRNRLLATSYSNLAGVYIELGEYRKARTYLDSAKQLNLSITTKSLEREVLKNELKLAMLDKARSENVMSQLDSIYEFQNRQYQEKYDTELAALTAANEKEKIILKEKQEAEIQSLELKSNQRFLILALGLLGVIAYLVLRQRKLGFERRKLQMQQRLLSTQMNPHFTSNIMYSIQNLVKESPETASKYLLKYSRLLRLTLENSTNNYVQLEDELETLNKYLELQQLRYDSAFDYNIVLNDLEEDDLIFIPPMLIQPIVENSIEHGLNGLDRKGSLVVTLSKQKQFIECQVEDNGNGLKSSDHSHKQSASTKLINEFLRKTTKSGLEIVNKSDIDKNLTGVRVTFLIPYKLTNND